MLVISFPSQKFQQDSCFFMHFNHLISLHYMLSFKKAPQHYSTVLVARIRVWYKETAPPNLINLKLIIAKSNSCVLSLNALSEANGVKFVDQKETFLTNLMNLHLITIERSTHFLKKEINLSWGKGSCLMCCPQMRIKRFIFLIYLQLGRFLIKMQLLVLQQVLHFRN